jgi:hypothetical protein
MHMTCTVMRSKSRTFLHLRPGDLVLFEHGEYVICNVLLHHDEWSPLHAFVRVQPAIYAP